MTKEYIGEIEIEDPFKSWFTDLDFYKWLAGFFGAIVVWCGKLSIDFIFKRNKDLDDVKNEVRKLGLRMNNLDADLNSVKRHSQKQSDEELRILRRIDKKLPSIWGEVAEDDK